MNLVNECKKTAAIILHGAGIGYDKLTAKTVSFSDLARAERVFVTVHGAKAARYVPCWDTAKAYAREHGFTLQYS